MRLLYLLLTIILVLTFIAIFIFILYCIYSKSKENLLPPSSGNNIIKSVSGDNKSWEYLNYPSSKQFVDHWKSLKTALASKLSKEAKLDVSLRQINSRKGVALLHFRCSDVPFEVHDSYALLPKTYYAYVAEILKMQFNIHTIILLNCNSHKADLNRMHKCHEFLNVIQEWLSEYLPDVKFIQDTKCKTIEEDWQSMIDSEVLISTGGSFAFIIGVLKGKNFISPWFVGKVLKNPHRPCRINYLKSNPHDAWWYMWDKSDWIEYKNGLDYKTAPTETITKENYDMLKNGKRLGGNDINYAITGEVDSWFPINHFKDSKSYASFWKSKIQDVEKAITQKSNNITFDTINSRKGTAIIHFRCSDVPFVFNCAYVLQPKSYFNFVANKLKIHRINNIVLVNCNKWTRKNNPPKECHDYLNVIQKWMIEFLPQTKVSIDTRCRNVELEWQDMLDCEILVSCGGSFSFFPGMLKGKNFISPNIPGACVGNKLACKTCLSWNWKDTNAWNKLHNHVHWTMWHKNNWIKYVPNLNYDDAVENEFSFPQKK